MGGKYAYEVHTAITIYWAISVVDDKTFLIKYIIRVLHKEDVPMAIKITITFPNALRKC